MTDAGPAGFTQRTVQVLSLADEEAKRLGERTISPQDLLVAILREGQGVAAMLLQVSGVRWEQAGEMVQISVIPDDQGKPVAIPADLQAALQQHPEEQRMFEAMSASKQQRLIDRIDRAHGDAARRQAVEGIIELLQQACENYRRTQQQSQQGQ